MKTLLIKNILFRGEQINILIEGNIIKALKVCDGCIADEVYDGTGKAILPSFFNTHVHAAMTMLRCKGDDTPLEVWLQQHIWPREEQMTKEDVRRGSEIAVREMIESGTTFFNDMYFDREQTIDVVAKSGIRAAIGVTILKNHNKFDGEVKPEIFKNWQDPTGGRIKLTVDPHSVYTTDPKILQDSARLCKEMGLIMHTHIAETKVEVENCVKATGMTPVRYLDSLGVLSNNVIAAHCVHVDKEEWDILANRGVSVSHCPCSNMKLGSGRFPYELALKSGVNLTLGTDGAASNNNLDLREEMKFAALLAKVTGDSALLSAHEIFHWATKNGAKAFGYNAGEIAEGKLADALIIDMNNVRMQECNDVLSNWVYAAESSSICATLCDGNIIFQR